MINGVSVGHVSMQLKIATSNGTTLAPEDIVMTVQIIAHIVNNMRTVDKEVMIIVSNRPITHLTQYPSPISNNVPHCNRIVRTCIFPFQMLHCGISVCCMVWICEMYLSNPYNDILNVEWEEQYKSSPGCQVMQHETV